MVKGRVYFLEAYLAYLLRRRVTAEERAVGHASRFCRFLLQRSQKADVEQYLRRIGNARYRQHVERSLAQFLSWLRQEAADDATPIAPIDSMDAGE